MQVYDGAYDNMADRKMSSEGERLANEVNHHLFVCDKRWVLRLTYSQVAHTAPKRTSNALERHKMWLATSATMSLGPM